MRVAVLGAGFPGLIMADSLRLADHEVDVFGRPEAAGVLSSMGPRHLWKNQALDTILSASQTKEVLVRWLRQGTLETITRVDTTAVDRHYRGYWMKSRGTAHGNPPCRGVSQFSIYEDGFDALARALDLGRFEAVTQPVIVVYRESARWFVETDGGTKHGPYDRVVTTLSPKKFNQMVRMPEPYYGTVPETSKVGYYWSKALAAQVNGYGAIHEEPHVIIYCGDTDIWWYRASKTPKGWCHEARPGRGPNPAEWKEEYNEAYTQLSKYEGSFAYPPGVVPVGRYAEWDGEAMVDTVYENRAEHVRKVEGLAISRRIGV